MIHSWNKYQFIIWDIPIKSVQNYADFNKQLQDELDKNNISNAPRAIESNGNTYSVWNIDTIPGFTNLLSSTNLESQLEKLNASNFTKIKRAWVNRMHKNSFVSIHWHDSNVKVLIIYYNVPDDSSDLILIDPKYKILRYENSISVPEDCKYNLKVKEGMCVLHNGDMLHAVSEHLSEYPRDTIIIELEPANKE